jgi:hypothetical protein
MLLLLTLFCIHALVGMWLEGDKCNILKEVRQSLQHDIQEEPVVMAVCELHKDKG